MTLQNLFLKLVLASRVHTLILKKQISNCLKQGLILGHTTGNSEGLWSLC